MGSGDTGSTCQNTGGQPCDWRAAAVENATRLGLTVVVSAGNSGDLGNVYPAYNSVESPGTAPSAITVGASTNSHIYYQRIHVSGPNVPAQLQSVNTYFWMVLDPIRTSLHRCAMSRLWVTTEPRAIRLVRGH